MDLFGNTALLNWLPDETLFSLSSRHHYFWGHSSGQQTSRLLFGRTKGGVHHDLPSCVDDFATRTEQRLGAASEICIDRTLLRYYRNFLDAGEEERMVAALRSHSVSHLKFQLGILTSRFRANHPLKACPTCISCDRSEFGWAYWHIQHQYPGVWICPVHGCALKESDLKSTGVGRFLWHLPDEAHLRPWPIQFSELPQSSRDCLASIMRLTIDLVDYKPRVSIDLAELYQVYRTELGKRNLLTANGGLRLSEIANQFLLHCQTIKVVPEFTAFPSTFDEAYGQVSKILRPARSGTHPLRHIAMIHWLFENSRKFFSAYAKRSFSQITPPDPTTEIIDLPPDIEDDLPKQKLKKLLLETKKSLRAAALELGIDTKTASVWAAQLGIKTSRRPKKLKSDLHQNLIGKLKTGIDKQAAATEFGISIVTVTQVLRSEVGLHKQWQQARHQIAQSTARKSWTDLLKKHGNLGTKFIRNINPGAYAWLYRNDREWLAEHKPNCATGAATSKPRVRWDERDLALSAAVEQAALKLRPILGKRKPMLWHFYQEIPELKAKLGALDRLPLTTRALEVALERRIPASALNDLLA